MVGSYIGDPTELAGGIVADNLLDYPGSSDSRINKVIIGNILSKLLNY